MTQIAKHIDWSDEFSVHVELIDRQHKEFVKVLNELYDCTLIPGRSKDVPDIFRRLDQYVTYHFSTEEKYFDEFKYEDSVDHKNAHQGFITKLNEYKDRYEKGEDIVLELLDFTEDWLVYHLAYYDKKYTKCFNEHGLK
jgi:hemerythrin-like metal-binding protein